jgi:hypothetical protein
MLNLQDMHVCTHMHILHENECYVQPTLSISVYTGQVKYPTCG